jgi:PAS domain S-box-containing protein
MAGSAGRKTGRKQANKLGRAPTWTESLLNSTPNVVLLFDRQWHYLYVNAPAVKAIGRPRDQVLADTIWNLYPDLVGTELERQARRTMTDRIPSEFMFCRPKDKAWWGIHLYPVPEGLAVYATDITKRKQAEEKVWEYQKAVEGLEEMIAVIDRDGRFILANPAYLKYLGLEKEQITGRLFSEFIEPEVYVREVKERVEECFQGKVVKYHLKYNFPELGERDLFLSCFPLAGQLGIDRLACIMQDITERKRADEEVRKLSRRLVHLQDDERRTIARELHDATGQNLVALETNLSLLRNSLPTSERNLRQLARLCQKLTDQSVLEVRTFRPVPLPSRPIGSVALTSFVKERMQSWVGNTRHLLGFE